MFLEQRIHTFSPTQFSSSAAPPTILGSTQRWNIDRTWPIEEVLLFVSYTVTAAAFASTATGSCTTPDLWDSILQIIQRINISVNDGRQPRSVVDISGVRSLEYASQVGLNLSPETWRQVQAANVHGAAALPIGTHQLVYRIPMVDPVIAEPLRSRLYLPVHTYPQDPVLTLTFNSLAGMGLTAGTMTGLYVDVVLVRREPTKESEALLQKTAGTNPTGYIDWDLIETPFQIPSGATSESRFALPVPGNYVNLLMTQYRGGGAALSKDVIDGSGVGDTLVNGFASESLWRLETGLVVKRNWRWKQLRSLNGYSRPQGNITSTNIGTDFVINPGGTATAFFNSAAVTYHDFLSDTVSGDSGNELGSLLDCNTPAQAGLKMEIIGTAYSGTIPSYLMVAGRRFFGDLSRWQKF